MQSMIFWMCHSKLTDQFPCLLFIQSAFQSDPSSSSSSWNQYNSRASNSQFKSNGFLCFWIPIKTTLIHDRHTHAHTPSGTETYTNTNSYSYLNQHSLLCFAGCSIVSCSYFMKFYSVFNWVVGFFFIIRVRLSLCERVRARIWLISTLITC